VPSFRRKLLVRLVIVLFIALFLLVALPLSTSVFNLATCISTVDDVTQVAVVSTMP
jgi:hypothetical protein